MCSLVLTYIVIFLTLKFTRHIILVIVIDYFQGHDVFFSVLIVASDKATSFDNTLRSSFSETS